MKRLSSECHEQFVKHWNDYPSQDNEGHVPDRGGFKCGWHEAWRWQQEKIDRNEHNLSIDQDMEDRMAELKFTVKTTTEMNRWLANHNHDLSDQLKRAQEELDLVKEWAKGNISQLHKELKAKHEALEHAQKELEIVREELMCTRKRPEYVDVDW